MSDLLRQNRVRARKEHWCYACYCDIPVGTEHHTTTYVHDGRVVTTRSCDPCEALLSDVWDWHCRPDEGVAYDDFREWAEEHAPEDPRAAAYLARVEADDE